MAPPPLPQGNTGIAARYPNDAGIAGDPAVLFADGYETYTTTGQLTSSGHYTRAFQAGNLLMDPVTFVGGVKALRMRMPATAVPVYNAVDRPITPALDRLFLRVYARYAPTYAGVQDAHNGLSISGRYPGPGTRPTGRDFFYVTVEESRYQQEGEPGYTHAYVYHPEQDDLYGEHWYPDGMVSNGVQNFGPDFVARPKVIPARGAWLAVEVMVQMNTPGVRDGRVAVWHNGLLMADWVNLRFRDVMTVQIDAIQLGNGGKGSTQANDKWYDQLVLATSYIGPMATGSAPAAVAPLNLQIR